jgi:hypothetical protein
MSSNRMHALKSMLVGAFKREGQSPIAIGGILAAIRKQLAEDSPSRSDHGQWLPWLRENFPHVSIRSVQNYLAAHDFSFKYPAVTQSLLTSGGLYVLITIDRTGNSEAVEATLAEAKTQVVDTERVYEIVSMLRQQQQLEASQLEEDALTNEAEDEAAGPGEGCEAVQPSEAASDEDPPPEGSPEDDAEEADQDDEDDEPFPEPPPSLTPKHAALLTRFETAVKDLIGLAARPTSEFTATAIADLDMVIVANFLRQVAEKKTMAAIGS